MLTFIGRTAVITGGSRGIGRAIARELCGNGMNVAILSKNSKKIEIAAEELNEEGYSCIGIPCDITDAQAVKGAMQQIQSTFSSVDVLINAAGIIDVSSIEEMTETHWDEVISTNLSGTFICIQQALPFLEKSGSARIINISSNAGRMGGYENGLAYTASKGGIISLTYGAARRLASKGITVNCVAPGTIETEMSCAYDVETRTRLLARFPLGRFGTAEEVAAAVSYFASVESGFTTGAVLDVNGGMFMG